VAPSGVNGAAFQLRASGVPPVEKVPHLSRDDLVVLVLGDAPAEPRVGRKTALPPTYGQRCAVRSPS
jgi:hypothetical protein